MTYEINNIYTLNVDCISELPDGRKYIYFKEQVNKKQLRVKALDFLSQPGTSLPTTIDVAVKEINSYNGLPLLYFSKNWLIDTLFNDESLPKKFSFNISNISNKGLSLKDCYGVIHYYPFTEDDSAENYSIGEQITMFVDEISTNSRGLKFLKLRKPMKGNQINQYLRVFTTRDINEQQVDKPTNKPNNSINFNYGEESEVVEFKQSLIYHPKYKPEDEANENWQSYGVFNIMRSIAGFMNHKGGTLYIGVKDNGSVHGINNDLAKLTEEGGYRYPENWDGWSRKVSDSVRKYLGDYAPNLINIEKEEFGGKIVGKISIKRSSKPIYVNNKDLFCRQCNATAKLNGDALTMFILERLRGDALDEFLNNKFGYDTDIEDIETDDETTGPSNLISINSNTHYAIDEERNTNDWLNIRLFDDGKYILTKASQRPEKYKANVVAEYQLKQYHKNEDQVLLLIYNDSHKVNKIDFAKKTNDWYATDRNNKLMARQANAPWTGGGSVTIKCVDRNDMIVAFYTEDNKDMCWVRDISYINPSQSDRSKALFTGGHKMTSENFDGKSIILHIPDSYRRWIAPIVNLKCEVNDPRKHKTIHNLISIINELYPEYDIQ
jgi:hypothetical protein